MDRLYEWFTGEPDAMKVASPVRREAVGKVLHPCSNSLAAHPTVNSPTNSDEDPKKKG
jgi:hypothetical protein